MRQVLSVFLLFFFATMVEAQTSKSTLFLGGGGSLGFGKYEEDTGATSEDSRFKVALNPTVGLFIKDGLLIAGMLDFNYAQSTPVDPVSGDKITDQKDVYTTLLFGPKVRYYHSSDFFAEGYVGLGKRTSSTFGGSAETSDNVLGWSVGVGKAFFLSETVALEPVIKYGSVKNTNDTSSGLFDKTSDFSFVFGLSFYLSK